MEKQTSQLTGYIELLHKNMQVLVERYKVKSLGIFGSYVHGRQREKSDLDILVEFFEPPGLLKFIEMEYYLSDLLGVKVDLVMKDALKPAIGSRILDEVITI